MAQADGSDRASETEKLLKSSASKASENKNVLLQCDHDFLL